MKEDVFRNKYGEPVNLHGPVCAVCTQRIGLGTVPLVSANNLNVCEHCYHKPTVKAATSSMGEKQ